MNAAVAAIVTYGVLALLWGLIFGLYLRHRRAVAGDPLIGMLLTVLALDAFKSLVESAYFGLVWGGNYGLLPGWAKDLGAPGSLTAVKVLNVVVAVVVLVRLARTWVPNEMKRREAQQAELERSLKQARDNEETLRLAVTASSEYIWDGDLKTNRVLGSPQARDWLGYAPEEWPPTPWDLIVHEGDRDAVREAIAKAIRGETPTYSIRHRLRRRDGAVLHAISTGVVVRDGAGRGVRFVGSVRDITHEVEEEGRRVQAQKLEGLGLLAGGIAHDFNNLLTVLGSSLELAARRAENGKDVSEPLQTASLAVSRATVLTRQLLAYAGRAPVAQRPVDLNDVVTAMGDLLSVSVSRKVALKRVLEAKLPAVRGDPAQLQQVVMNLITNAAEAIGDREGTVTLKTESLTITEPLASTRSGAVRGPVVRLTVTDTGGGMSPEVQARIFDPFFSTKGSGRGLGLAALAGILKSHGGSIGLESTVGVGSTFTVDLPALDAPLDKPAAAPGQESSKIDLKVLVVDDEALLRRSARRLLEMLGCVVDEAETGRQAVDRVRKTPDAWQVVLMDVTMPEMSGTEAAEEIRRLAPKLPIVLSSGYSAEAEPTGDRLFHLAKPYSIQLLEAVLRKARDSA